MNTLFGTRYHVKLGLSGTFTRAHSSPKSVHMLVRCDGRSLMVLYTVLYFSALVRMYSFASTSAEQKNLIPQRTRSTEYTSHRIATPPTERSRVRVAAYEYTAAAGKGSMAAAPCRHRNRRP